MLRSGPRKRSELTSRFQVCSKTIQRDLDFLRQDLGHDIRYDGRAHSWSYQNIPICTLL